MPTTSNTEYCNACNQIVPLNRYQGHLRSLQHKANSCVNIREGVEIVQTAFQKRIISYRFSAARKHLDYGEFFCELKEKVFQVMEYEIVKHKALKINAEVFGRYIHQAQELVDVKSFNTAYKVINEGADKDEIWTDFIDVMKTKASEFEESESGMM